MNQRIREMDFIRAVSALAIIVIHVTGLYVYTSRGAYYANQLVRFAVPVFILISGLLLSLSGCNFTGVKGYMNFIRRRLNKIFIPYLLWSFIYIFFKIKDDLSPLLTNPGSFLAKMGRTLLFGTGYIHLYFIIIIFQLYLLFPLLKFLMKKWSSMVLTFCFLLTLVFQTGIWLQSIKIGSMPVFILPNYMFFPTWIFYFAFGMYFAENLEKWKERINSNILILVPIWTASLILLLADSKYTGTLGLSIKPSVMLYSFVTFFLMYSVALKLKYSRLKLLKALEWVSSQSFLIYLSHLFIMNVIVQRTGYPANTGIWSGFKGMLLLYAADTLCTCLLAYLLSLTPLASIFGGVRRKKPERAISSTNTRTF